MLNALNFNLSPLFEHQNWKRYCAWYNQRRICSKYRANHTEMITKHILGGHKLWFKFNVTPAISSIKHQVSPQNKYLVVWTFNKTYHNAFSKLFWFCYDSPLQHLVSVSVTRSHFNCTKESLRCKHHSSVVTDHRERISSHLATPSVQYQLSGVELLQTLRWMMAPVMSLLGCKLNYPSVHPSHPLYIKI